VLSMSGLGQLSLTGSATERPALPPVGTTAPATVPGTRPTASVPAPPATRGASLLLNAVAGFFLVYVLVWNLTGVSSVTLTEDARAVGSFVGLGQYWTMFAPYPTTSTTWYVIPGTLQDGRQIDLVPFVVHDDPHLLTAVDWEKPHDLRGTF